MPLKDLLVHLDASSANRQRLDYALLLAAREDAHLVGLYTLDMVPSLAELARAYPGRIEHYETYIKLRGAKLDLTKQAEAQFRDALRREGVAGEWRLVEGPHDQTVALHSRYADLAIVGQIDPAQRPADSAARIPEATLLTSGRPVMIVPYAGTFSTIGDHVLVGWNATREAARALADALPFLERARKVTVLTVNPAQGIDAEPGISAADVALHLARHGVRAEAATTGADDIGIGDLLLNYIADCGADLLVIGGYGHARAREAIFGGVTRQILQQMTVPVLMAH
jgi:nucleotide-binding universal stress UspA family protein